MCLDVFYVIHFYFENNHIFKMAIDAILIPNTPATISKPKHVSL